MPKEDKFLFSTGKVSGSARFFGFSPGNVSCQGSGFCNHLLFQRALSLSPLSLALVSVTSSCRVCGPDLPGRPLQKASSRVSSQVKSSQVI